MIPKLGRITSYINENNWVLPFSLYNYHLCSWLIPPVKIQRIILNNRDEIWDLTNLFFFLILEIRFELYYNIYIFKNVGKYKIYIISTPLSSHSKFFLHSMDPWYLFLQTLLFYVHIYHLHLHYLYTYTQIQNLLSLFSVVE